MQSGLSRKTNLDIVKNNERNDLYKEVVEFIGGKTKSEVLGTAKDEEIIDFLKGKGKGGGMTDSQKSVWSAIAQPFFVFGILNPERPEQINLSHWFGPPKDPEDYNNLGKDLSVFFKDRFNKELKFLIEKTDQSRRKEPMNSGNLRKVALAKKYKEDPIYGLIYLQMIKDYELEHQ